MVLEEALVLLHDRRIGAMKDLTALLEEVAKAHRSPTMARLGRSQRIVVDRDTTTIIGGGGSKPAIEAEAARCEGDERTALHAFARALEVPARQIATNSRVDGGIVVERLRHGEGNIGFDAAAGRYVDLVANGIIDPARVVRVALENAVSVAGTLLLAEGTLTEIREPRPTAAESELVM